MYLIDGMVILMVVVFDKFDGVEKGLFGLQERENFGLI